MAEQNRGRKSEMDSILHNVYETNKKQLHKEANTNARQKYIHKQVR